MRAPTVATDLAQGMLSKISLYPAALFLVGSSGLATLPWRAINCWHRGHFLAEGFEELRKNRFLTSSHVTETSRGFDDLHRSRFSLTVFLRVQRIRPLHLN